MDGELRLYVDTRRHQHYNFDGPVKLERSLEDLVFSRHCPLCALVYAGLEQEEGFSDIMNSSQKQRLLCYIEASHPELDTGCYFYTYRQGSPLSLWRRIYRLRATILDTLIQCRIQRYASDTDTRKERILRGRDTLPVVDDALLRSWLDLCDSRHYCMIDMFTRNPSADTVVWMIDVQKRMIVPWTERDSVTRYAALTYVWGGRDVRQLRHTSKNAELLRLPGGIDKGDVEMPTTIHDAIALCMRLQIDYVW